MSRATPLSPDERRASLIAVTRDLIREHGHDVTTKQVADAAGVAEGTVFRVFPTRQDLIAATVADELSSARLDDLLAAVAPTDTLDDTTEACIRTVADYAGVAAQLFKRPGCPAGNSHDPHDVVSLWRDRLAQLHGWIDARLAPFDDDLLPTRSEFTHVVFTLGMGLAHNLHSPSQPNPALLTRIALDGARRKETPC